MATLGEKAESVAMSQIGTGESPWGSNRGPCEKYQNIYGRGFVGLSWCGCFVGWVWEQVKAGGKDYSSPSVQIMCNAKPNVHAQPGAAFAICGVHTGILRYQMATGVWATVEGNHGNQVAVGVRDVRRADLEIVGPPWLGDKDPDSVPTPPKPPPTAPWYFLQDTGAVKITGQHSYYGGWASAEARDKVYANLKAELGHELRKFKDTAFSSPFFLDNSAFVTEVYGGWRDKDAREEAKGLLEDRLNRALRPFAEERTNDQGGAPWACKNLA